MNSTVFKDVPARYWREHEWNGTKFVSEPTLEYHQMMGLIGDHLAAGGSVDFDQRIIPGEPMAGKPYEMIDCTLHHPEPANG